jgi:hypothetical protein
MGDTLEVKGFDKLINGQLFVEIGFVSKNQEWDTFEYGLPQKIMKLVPCDWQSFCICGINDKHDGVYPSAISLPHGPKSWLSTEIPTLQCHMPLLYALHVEPNRRNRTVGDVSVGYCLAVVRGAGLSQTPHQRKEGIAEDEMRREHTRE